MKKSGLYWPYGRAEIGVAIDAVSGIVSWWQVLVVPTVPYY